MKFIFGMKINMDIIYKLILSLWVCVARHAQSTQSNKFVISLQYLKENVNDEVDSLPANKHQRFLQSDTIILGVKVSYKLILWFLMRKVKHCQSSETRKIW